MDRLLLGLHNLAGSVQVVDGVQPATGAETWSLHHEPRHGARICFFCFIPIFESAPLFHCLHACISIRMLDMEFFDGRSVAVV